MTFRGLALVFLLGGLVSAAAAGGRFVPQAGKDRPRGLSRTVEFDLSYDFSVPGQTRRVEFRVVVPQTIENRQNILSVSYSPKPSRILDENGNRYAEFVFVKPDRHVNVTMTVKAELFEYDLLTARLSRGAADPASEPFDDFLRHEKYIEKDHQLIQEIAEDIEGETDIDIVKSIYDHVLDNMEYSGLGRKDWGAVKAVQLGKGDCTEYSDLFVALCRARGIPARVASGYTVGFVSTSSRHNWAEVYLDQYGWVPFDPTAGDVENVMIRGMAFSRMRPAYIYVSHVRNDPVLRNYNFGAYRYWGDRITFKDSIEFRPSAPLFPETR
ncbi:MAG: transglutaminase domain-containing protein [Phycisphaerales bacterium]|nr:MAG: transglutaminase domain-containing protein [Phycisphaerales bacterium]